MFALQNGRGFSFDLRGENLGHSSQAQQGEQKMSNYISSMPKFYKFY